MSRRKKQWKDQLNRWQFRKRLNKEDAAHILHLLEEADEQSIQRTVLFNTSKKTKEDIQAYIRKSDLVSSREDLLQYLDLDDRSPYITWRDNMSREGLENLLQTPSDIPVANWPLPAPTGEIAQKHQVEADAFLQTMNPENQQPRFETDMDYQQSLQDHERSTPSPNSFVEVPLVGDVVSIPSDSSAVEEDSPHAAEAFAGDDSQRQNPSPLPDLPGPYTDSVSEQLLPRDTLPVAMAQRIDPRRLNGLLSNSPLQTHLGPDALAKRIDEMFSKMEAVGRDAVAQSRVAIFLRHCCAATIYGGQGYQHQRQASIGDAVDAFRQILFSNPWDSLTTLNNMYALLGMYGHRIVILDILAAVGHAVDQFVEIHGRSNCALVVQSVLHFMTTIPETGTRPAYEVESLAQMEQLAVSSFADRREFALSAAYIHAWGLLEMKRNAEALQKLNELRPECEEVFDYGQFQTICWLATLARAYAANGRNKMAANTYRDVAGRIARYFSASHPQYWDSVYRQACYDRRVIDDCDDVDRQRQGWLSVAHDMRHTLKWRAEVLGPVNPLTLQNFRALRGVLKKLQKVDDSATFEQVLNIDLS